MLHRLFIAIAIPSGVKEKISAAINSRKRPLFRFVKKENWHITVLFLGYARDFEIPVICREIEQSVKNRNPFFINFTKIIYGPDLKNPRMIWAVAEKNKEYENFRDNLQNQLARRINFKIDNRPVHIHITLARRRACGNVRDGLPPLEANISLQFSAESVDLMESILKGEGAEYIILKNYILKNYETVAQ